jgi:hypothetical protein
LAHFARIKNGIVDFVTVGRDDDESREDELAHDGWIYRRTSYNTRGGVHYTLTVNPLRISPKPSARTTLASATCMTPFVMLLFHHAHTLLGYWMSRLCLWNAPVAMPEDAGTGEPPKRYTWDEVTTSWKLIEE